jgi:hypothetical protein
MIVAAVGVPVSTILLSPFVFLAALCIHVARNACQRTNNN